MEPAAVGDGATAVIGYDGSLQAARTLATYVSTGLAANYENVVVTISEDIEEAAQTAERAVDYLALHGVAVKARPVETRLDPAAVLLDAYKAYFSEAYNELRRAIAAMRTQIEAALGDRQIAAFERTIDQNAAGVEFWSRFAELPALPWEAGAGVVARRQREVAEVVDRERRDARVTDLAGERDRLLENLRRPRMVACREHDRAEVAQCIGDETGLASFAGSIEGGLGKRGGGCVVALQQGDRSGGGERAAKQ